MRTAKTLIRLGWCPGWSESSLGAQSFCWFCHVAAQLLAKQYERCSKYILTSKRNASSKSLRNCLDWHHALAKYGLSLKLLVVFHLMAYWKFGSVFCVLQNSGGSTIYKDAMCARYVCFCNGILWVAFKVVLKTRNHKTFEMQRSRKASKRHNEIYFGVFAILKYGRICKSWCFTFLLVMNDISCFGTSWYSSWESLYQILLMWVFW